jgi:outer membrane protein OmpA-like peptidoglycan-associated protein
VSGFRELLAVLSLLCGLTLAVLAARTALRGKTLTRARAWALGVYSLLFVAAAIVLWTRGEPRQVRNVLSPRSETSSPPPVSRETEQATHQFQGPESEHPLTANPRDGDRGVHPPPAPDVADNRGEIPTLAREAPPLRRVGKRPLHVSRVRPASPDDPIASAVLRAFDAIERWFWRYGSPAPVASAAKISEALGEERLSLPAIIFVGYTAELTPEGALRLKQLAGDLRSRPDSGVIEIWARTDDADPTPFPFILTQARAEVVRDFLMHEGVRNFRLIPQAARPDSEDSTMARPQVRLVFRR